MAKPYRAMRNFITRFLDAVVDNGLYSHYIEDMRGMQPTEREERLLWSDEAKYADAAVMTMVLRDRHYDVSTGYTLSCIDYSDITDDPNTPDDASDYYWIKVIGRYYRSGNPHAAPEMRVDTPNGGSYSQAYIELTVYVCLDYEYGIDEHWSGGKTISFVRGAWTKRIPMRTYRAPRHNVQSLADEALKGFANAALPVNTFVTNSQSRCPSPASPVGVKKLK